jgi:hypothetical protein
MVEESNEAINMTASSIEKWKNGCPRKAESVRNNSTQECGAGISRKERQED